jgi:hypothetical protein
LKIEELKSLVEGWPRKKCGRLTVSAENAQLIAEVFHGSGLGRLKFAEATGLAKSTVYRALVQKPKSNGRSRTVKQSIGFKAVKVIESPARWIVSGPSGLRVEFSNINQLTQLWRSLC